MHTKTKAKMLADEEVAVYEVDKLSDDDLRQMLRDDNDPDKPAAEVPVEGYTPLLAKLDEVVDQLIVNRESIQRAFSKQANGRKIKLAPRPKTAYQKVLEKRKLEFERSENHTVLSALGF